MSIHIVYHHPCLDGIFAALAAWLKFGPAATYHPMGYQKPLPEIPDGSVVFFVDFSAPRADLEALAERCHVVVLDHHKTAQEALAGLPSPYELPDSQEGPMLMAHFDMEKSGAVLAWEYFQEGRAMPYLYELVQDGDLWKWEFGDDTRRFRAFMQVQELTLETANRVLDMTLGHGGFDEIFFAGDVLLRAQDQNVDRLCYNAFWMNIDGHAVIAANAPILQSEVGHKLLELFPASPFAAAFTVADGRMKYSLRGRGDFDVSEIAKKFGGGGHKSAAGFDLKGDERMPENGAPTAQSAQ